jgi:preprotein translocase subunit YajC
MQLFYFLQGQGGGLIGLLPMLLIFVVLYFFFIRPQVKKQKEQNAFMAEIKKGDEVVTASGIIGQINKIEDNEVSLQVDSKTFLRITKGAISKEMTDAYKK